MWLNGPELPLNRTCGEIVLSTGVSVCHHLEWIFSSCCGVLESMRDWSKHRGWSTAQQSCTPADRSCMSCRGSACVGGSGMMVCIHSQRQESGSESCRLPPTLPEGSGARPLGPPEAGGSPCPLCLERSIHLWTWWRRRWLPGCRGKLGCVSAAGSCWEDCRSRWRLGGCRVSSGSDWEARPAAEGYWGGSVRWTPVELWKEGQSRSS